MTSSHTLIRTIALLAVAAASLVVFAATATARTYKDVPERHWAYAYINTVTNRSSAGHRVLDDYRTSFKPERAITREQLARSLVLASGHYRDKLAPREITDVPPGHRYYRVIQIAVRRGYLSASRTKEFKPKTPVTAAEAEVAMIRWLKERYATSDWRLLSSLVTSRWQPNEGWKTKAPSYLPSVIASRQLQLRYNHPTGDDGHEVTPKQPIDRAELAYMFERAYKVSGEWTLYGLADYHDITFPTLSDRQKEIASFALKYVGYPYVWAGEYPTRNSPYGYQASGGFDCSGFVFFVMKMHFDYPITVNERGAHDMAARAKPRITRKKLVCGDLIFFGPSGPQSSVNSIYHAGLYLGNGWFIHSTGSSDGVTLCSLDTSSYYKSAFAWGRRVLTPGELVVTQAARAAMAPSQPAPAATATPVPSPTAEGASASPSPDTLSPDTP